MHFKPRLEGKFSCFACLFLSEQTLKRMSLSLFLNNSLQNLLVVVRTSLASSPPQKIILEGGIWEWLQGEVWGNVLGGLRVGLCFEGDFKVGFKGRLVWDWYRTGYLCCIQHKAYEIQSLQRQSKAWHVHKIPNSHYIIYNVPNTVDSF